MLLFHVNRIGLAIISGCLEIENRADEHTEVWLAEARIVSIKYAEVSTEVFIPGRSPTLGNQREGIPKTPFRTG